MQVLFDLGFIIHQNFKTFSPANSSKNLFFLLIISHGYLACFSINNLTPELNPSEQRCLPGFFTGNFKFHFLVLEKKSILHRLLLQI